MKINDKKEAANAKNITRHFKHNHLSQYNELYPSNQPKQQKIVINKNNYLFSNQAQSTSFLLNHLVKFYKILARNTYFIVGILEILI